LVVNDHLQPRARLPQTGAFTHLSRFDAPWHSTVGGGFREADKPELKMHLTYRQGDLGAWLDVNNAELTIYHQWDDSIVGLTSHDPDTQTLRFSNASGYPPGAFGVTTYVVWNVRAGMHEPGQWYLDRSRGRVVYWPHPGEDLSGLNVIAPTAEWVICIRGNKGEPVTGVTLRGLGISATTAPCVSGGFGAEVFSGAVEAEFIRDNEVSNNEVSDAPYIGIGFGGWKNRYERNLVHDVMKELRDGAAFYGDGQENVLRGNMDEQPDL
jgi:hypothetical protein